MARTFAALAVGLGLAVCAPARTEAHPGLAFSALLIAGGALTLRQTGRRAKRERFEKSQAARASEWPYGSEMFARYP
jgi:hypothetical protein